MGDRDVVITGVGLLTPLGRWPGNLLERLDRGESAAEPCPFHGVGGINCPAWARIRDFDAEKHVPEPKTLRLMNRDAMLAVAAARMAVADSGVRIGEDYAPEDVGLFGATGLAGVGMGEVSRLVEASAGESGKLDLRRFGSVALKQVRPVLSFKILSNMPVCFVSIFEGIQGVNAVYGPWEADGARAIVSAVRAIEDGDAECALAGGCDVKTHELGILALSQWGRLDGACVPGEGAGWVVLEERKHAEARGAKTCTVVCAQELSRRGNKKHIGNLFAAEAVVEIGLSAACARCKEGA